MDDFDAVLAVNVRGTFLCYKYAAQKMVDQGTKGRIIGASSLAGKKGQYGVIQPDYFFRILPLPKLADTISVSL